MAKFFGFSAPDFDHADEDQAPQVIRFLEWALLDRAVDGETPAARYAAQAGEDEQSEFIQTHAGDVLNLDVERKAFSATHPPPSRWRVRRFRMPASQHADVLRR